MENPRKLTPDEWIELANRETGDEEYCQYAFPHPPTTVDGWIEEGNSLIRKNYHHQPFLYFNALVAFMKALQIDPEAHDAWSGRAEVLTLLSKNLHETTVASSSILEQLIYRGLNVFWLIIVVGAAIIGVGYTGYSVGSNFAFTHTVIALGSLHFTLNKQFVGIASALLLIILMFSIIDLIFVFSPLARLLRQQVYKKKAWDWLLELFQGYFDEEPLQEGKRSHLTRMFSILFCTFTAIVIFDHLFWHLIPVNLSFFSRLLLVACGLILSFVVAWLLFYILHLTALRSQATSRARKILRGVGRFFIEVDDGPEGSLPPTMLRVARLLIVSTTRWYGAIEWSMYIAATIIVFIASFFTSSYYDIVDHLADSILLGLTIIFFINVILLLGLVFLAKLEELDSP